MKDGRELDISAYWAAALAQRAGEIGVRSLQDWAETFRPPAQAS